MINNLTIKSIDKDAHTLDNFREQIFALYPTGTFDQSGKFILTHLKTCEPGSASLDPNSSSNNTPEAWNGIKSVINQGARGFLHTHPSGFDDFSSMDYELMRGIAMAFGPRLIWHGVQPFGKSHAHFVCMHMLQGNTIIMYDFGQIETSQDLTDPILLLPLPPKIQETNGILRVNCDDCDD